MVLISKIDSNASGVGGDGRGSGENAGFIYIFNYLLYGREDSVGTTHRIALPVRKAHNAVTNHCHSLSILRKKKKKLKNNNK